MVSVLRPGQHIHNIPAIGVQTSRRAVQVAAAADWWLAGGAPAPLVVYQPKDAADLAASYVNLANPGTYDAAPGVAPTLGASGWAFDSASSQYLVTGWTPSSSQNQAIVVKFSSVSADALHWLAGTYRYGYGAFGIRPSLNGNNVQYNNGGSQSGSPQLASGVLGIAGGQGYRNGTADGAAIGGWSAQLTSSMTIGCLNNSGTMVQFLTGNIQAIAVWDTSTNHATWMPAVMAAVALI